LEKRYTQMGEIICLMGKDYRHQPA